MTPPRRYDIIIVGAGVAGINTAYRIQTMLPNYSYAILEARDVAGGTWDLFRYPGVRLDTGIHTFGFPWQTYHHDKTMLDGSSMLEYINSSAKKHKIDNHILFGHQLKKLNWDTQESQWTLTAEYQDQEPRFTAKFVIFATGYYDYEQPLPAEIPGLSRYKGVVVHPQFWPEDLDYAGKRIAVIGSGSTAISMVPKLAETASAVTMIQRSPSYIVSIPDSVDTWLSRLLPVTVLHMLKRYRFMAVMLASYYFCRNFPRLAKYILLRLAGYQLPDHVPLSPHFTPKYDPWDQRLLACPDGDFFRSLHTGKTNIETANIKTVTESSVVLDNGRFIDADIIVTATGLRLQIGGGAQFELDGKPCDIAEKVMWKGMMLQDIPNCFFVLGHLTDASWTLGADAVALLIHRMINHMDKEGIRAATPRMYGSPGKPSQLWKLNANYMLRGENNVPRAGENAPWNPRTNYILDYFDARYGSFDSCMEFSGGYGNGMCDVSEFVKEK
ncbi:monooxygenase [Aspergillus bombycis]|uniref:Monooxygenase n=1 Tax=Aspergillus bombycis TaxID=109264 RepID=A0A1F7ZYE0_9EURO|nr:monooxygenase [Aspergillus bombycis]OGM44105.1 monooxygenase [Aspergillus bombycis]